MKRLRLACLVAAIFMTLGNVQAQDALPLFYPKDALLQLKETPTPAVANAAEKISENWMFIADSFAKVGLPTEDFRRVMEHNKLLLEKAASDPDNQLSETLISDVETDISIKAKYISESPVFTVSALSEVIVEVSTIKNGNEVHGYFIGFSPKHLAGQNPMYRFNNPTSPSNGTLPPGRYEMTAILNGQIVQRQEVSVGILGQQGQPIKCVVP